MTKRILKKEAEELSLTREQISERAIEIAEMIINGSYKNAVAGIGRMVTLSECIMDSYWDEKFSLGRSYESYFLKSGMRPDHPDKNIEVN